MRWPLTFILTLVLCSIAASPIYARQSASTASICAVTFNDLNGNAVRDPGESTLANVNVSLMITLNGTNVIINNHVSDAKEAQYCFSNLVAGTYTLAFSSPLINPTTLDSFNFLVNGGETVIREFGGVPKDQAAPQAANTGLVIPLTRPVRIGLAIGGALLVMLLTIGVGLILRGVYGIIARR